jgi:hypothetical protein
MRRFKILGPCELNFYFIARAGCPNTFSNPKVYDLILWYIEMPL